MTTPKEALEGLIEAVMRDANGPGGRGISGYTSARLSDAKSALASLQGEDAVERVARIIDPYAWTDLDDMTPTERFVRESRLPWMREDARTKARAILATGLVPDEAATALTEARAEIQRLQERVFELKHGVKDQMEEAAYHKQKRDTAESELSTLRARVREVVGPFGNLAQRYNDTVSDGWIPWIEFITNHEWPSELDCSAARQLMEEVK